MTKTVVFKPSALALADGSPLLTRVVDALGTNAAARFAFIIRLAQHYLLSTGSGQRTTGHSVAASIASRRLYFARRSDCVMEPGLN